ncbi:MAG: hypothetical protein WC916_02195 [Candidatus Woesearchaeota archaeon]
MMFKQKNWDPQIVLPDNFLRLKEDTMLGTGIPDTNDKINDEINTQLKNINTYWCYTVKDTSDIQPFHAVITLDHKKQKTYLCDILTNNSSHNYSFLKSFALHRGKRIALKNGDKITLGATRITYYDRKPTFINNIIENFRSATLKNDFFGAVVKYGLIIFAGFAAYATGFIVNDKIIASYKNKLFYEQVNTITQHSGKPIIDWDKRVPEDFAINHTRELLVKSKGNITQGLRYIDTLAREYKFDKKPITMWDLQEYLRYGISAKEINTFKAIGFYEGGKVQRLSDDEIRRAWTQKILPFEAIDIKQKLGTLYYDAPLNLKEITEVMKISDKKGKPIFQSEEELKRILTHQNTTFQRIKEYVNFTNKTRKLNSTKISQLLRAGISLQELLANQDRYMKKGVINQLERAAILEMDIKQYLNPLDTKKPNALITYPVHDWNRAYDTFEESSLIKELKDQYDLTLVACETKQDVYQALSKNKYALWISKGHGSPQGFIIGYGVQGEIGIGDTVLQRYIRHNIEKKGVMAFNSCRLAAQVPNEINFIQDIESYLETRRIIAAKDTTVSAMEILSTYPFDAKLKYGDKDVTYTNMPSSRKVEYKRNK